MKRCAGFPRTWYLLAVCSLVVLPAAICQGDAPLEGTRPAQWRVVWNSDPATTATLVWSTAQPGAKHQVRIGIRGQQERKLVDAQRNGRHSVLLESTVLYYHTLRLEGLRPETAYDVELISDGQSSPKLYFVTAALRDRGFSLLFGGDSRSDQKQRQIMNELLGRLFRESQQQSEAEQIVAFVHGGDYVESGRNLKQWTQWLSDQELTTSPDGRLLPIIPTRGNHDGGPLFNEVFGFPPSHANYFGLSLTPQVRLVTLNSETAIAGNQSAWLKSELSTWRPKVRWLVTEYHRPVYPAVKTPSEGLKFWVPLFEQYNVDLACEADGHVLKRTVPIRNGELNETGVVYVGEGGLGVKQRTPKATRWFLQAPGMSGSAHHVQLLTFREDGLRYRAIDENGKTLDETTFKVRNAHGP